MPTPAEAANECGIGGVIVCNTLTYNSANGDIVYAPTNAGAFSFSALGISVTPTGAPNNAIDIRSTASTPSGRPLNIVIGGTTLNPLAGGTGLVVQSGTAALAGGVPSSPGAAIDINFQGSITRNGGAGIAVTNWGIGATNGLVNLGFNGTITGAGGTGISVSVPFGGRIVATTAGSIAGGNGIVLTDGGSSYNAANPGSSAGIELNNSAAITANGGNVNGIDILSYYNRTSVINSGAINVTGANTMGIYASTGQNTGDPAVGNAVIVSNGTVTVNATGLGGAHGIYVRNQGNGMADLTSNAAVVVNSGNFNGYGLRSESYGGVARVTSTATVTTTGTQDPSQPGAIGISVGSFGTDATDSATALVSASVSTTGPRANAIQADSGPGKTTVIVTGTAGVPTRITTNGTNSIGISTQTFDFGIPSGDVEVRTDAFSTVSTVGNGSHGVLAVADDGRVSVTTQASVTTNGVAAHGIQTLSSNGNTTIDAVAVTALGQSSSAIRAFTNIGVADVIVRGSAQGGWDGALLTYGVFFGNGAAGGASHLTILPGAQVGALSDRAIGSALRLGSHGGVTTDNFGTVTGFVSFANTTGGAVTTFNNYSSNSFAIRNFADTDGDGIRDIKRVSISSFGGQGSSFNNLTGGLVRFAPVANAARTDATGYYVPTTGIDSRPLEPSFYNLNREGIVQGQFVNLQTFNNAGTIDLRGPEIGNTLVMTSNPAAGGAPGTGTFVANGGQLLVNTRLNDGIAPGGASNSYSDMLIVDRTRLGSGPTSIVVSYAASVPGALTLGNGIEIVEVRDKANSAGGVFILGNRVAGSAYEYRLYHNGVGSDATDGNWYLRSTLIVDPGTPGPGPEPTPPVERPNYRVEVPVDIVVPALASRLGMTMIGTLDDRYGPDFAPLSEQPPAPAPAREIWCKDAARNFRCTPTPQQNAYYAGTTAGTEAPLPAGHLFWTRVFGQFGAHNSGGRTDLDRFNAFERRGPSYDYRLGGIQFGVHLYRDHLNTAGLYFGYGHIASAVDTVYGGGRAGSTAMDAYSLGGYWTHRRPGGWYFDTVLQATWYGAINTTSVLGESLKTKGWGLAASLETGYPIALGAGWTLTPQIQAIYQALGFDSGADRFGQIHYGDTSTVYGRAGARLSRDFAIEDGRKVTAWARVNYWHTFGGNAHTTFTNLAGGYPVVLGTGLGGSWMQFGIGASGQVTQSLSVFATGDYNLTVANGSGQSYTGRVGLQMRW